MNNLKRRIAINIGGGFVPGLNAVIAGTVMAAHHLDWEVVGIRDGFDGLLFPERYPDGGTVNLTPRTIGDLYRNPGVLLGTATHTDPFHVRSINAMNGVEEVDRSDELLELLRIQDIDSVISVVGGRAMSILFKLHRKGLKTVCIPKSIENDIAATQLSFGFNSALSFATEILDRARQAAESARKIAVVEVPGEHAGWLALQSGIAVCADAILIPEIPYDLKDVGELLREGMRGGRRSAMIVVAEGAGEVQSTIDQETSIDSMRASLSPGATGHSGDHVIERSGHVAQSVALQIQRLTDCETYPIVLGELVSGGPPTAVDRQLGLGYGASAVRALQNDQSGVMVGFEPPELKFVPMSEAINKVRTVPIDSMFMKIAHSLGILLGEGVRS